MALRFPGEKSFPSPISVVSLTCCHFPDTMHHAKKVREREETGNLSLLGKQGTPLKEKTLEYYHMIERKPSSRRRNS